MQQWKTKRGAMRHYDHLAPFYDAQYSEEQKDKIKVALNSTKLSQNQFILDVGCGTGLLFQYIAKSAKLVVGMDISPKILLEAKKHTKQLSNTAVIRADADHIPFQNQTFDHVFAITLLQNMPNPLKTIREIKRVSKPQATIIVTALKKKFTQECFIDLLNKTELKISTIKTNQQLKGHIAICRNQRKYLKDPSKSITVRKQKCQPTDP